MIFFVYKFRIRKCGLFYIGVTTNIDIRTRSHLSGIHQGIYYIKRGRGRYSSVYVRVGKYLYFNYARVYRNYKFVKSMFSIKVLDIKDTAIEASQMESELLDKYKKNPKLLNRKLISNYCKKTT